MTTTTVKEATQEFKRIEKALISDWGKGWLNLPKEQQKLLLIEAVSRQVLMDSRHLANLEWFHQQANRLLQLAFDWGNN